MANTKQTFEIKIAGTDYSSYISYPVSITEKNLEESLNLGEITLSRMNTSAPFKPNRKVIVYLYVDNVLVETYYFLLMSDIVSKIGYANLYNHKLTLIEYTYAAEQVILPNFTITRVEGIHEPTLLDAAARVRDLMIEVSGIYAFFDEATQALLSSELSPEFTFTRKTALEAYRVIFSLVKAVPEMYLEESETLDVTVNGMRHVKVLDELANSLDDFSYKEEAYNPETYKTALHSNVQHFVTGTNDSITEPANGWLTPRSPDGYKIQEDNAMIPTSRPIYKLQKLEVNRFMVVGSHKNVLYDDAYKWVSVPHSIVPLEWFEEHDTKDFVFEKDYWNTRLNTEEYGQKGASFYYTQSKKNIENLTYIPPARWSWFPNKQAWRNVIDEWIPTFNQFSSSYFIKPEYVAQAEAAALAYWESIYGTAEDDIYYDVGFEEDATYLTSYSADDISIYDMQFRVTYTPEIDTDLYTYRERKFEDDDEINSFQVYNQQATTIDSEVLGMLHDKVIKRGSGTSLTLSYMHRTYNDILPKNHRIEDYIITSKDITYTMYGIKVIYNLDKFYAKLQKYVAVLEEYRQYSIPNEGIVTRQKTINSFAKISAAPISNSIGVDASYYIGNAANEVNLFKLDYTVLPTTNFAFNNSLVFETTFEGNSSSGVKSESFDSNTRVDRPTEYADRYGRIEETRRIKFGTDFSTFNLTDSYNLPENLDDLAQEFYSKLHWIEKDAREILSFSFQLHHIDTTGKFYLNSGFAKINGLVGGVGLNDSTIKMGFFNTKPHNNKVIPAANISSIQPLTFTVSTETINIPAPQNTSGSSKPAWGCVQDMGDGNYEVLFWADEVTEDAATVNNYYINFDDEY